jgi:hypothetical protein
MGTVTQPAELHFLLTKRRVGCLEHGLVGNARNETSASECTLNAKELLNNGIGNKTDYIVEEDD